ncbi:hypothetical protein SLS57_009981 [Botryosphaeria dothidea]
MRDGHYTDGQRSKALKYFLIFELLCLPALICIRNSLILTLSRLTRSRPILYLLYFLMFLNTAGTIAAIIFLIAQCRPIRANWDAHLTASHCLPPTHLVTMAKTWSAFSVVCDWTVALLPIPLLWNVRMRWRVKGAVMGILGLGIFCATLIRIPILPTLTSPKDSLYHIGVITLWAFLETGLGLLAASLTSLRPLLRRVFGGGGADDDDDDGVLVVQNHAHHDSRKYHRGWYGRGEDDAPASRIERWLRGLGFWSSARRGGSRYGLSHGSGRKSGKGKSGEQLVGGGSGSRGADDSWETMMYGETSVGMRTVVVEGAAAAGEDGESQKSFVGEGDIKVRRSICVEVPDD